MLKILQILLILCAVCFFCKLIVWSQIKQTNARFFVNSFFRYYTNHALHDSQTIQSKRFKSLSNLINVIFWGAIIAIAFIIIFNMETFLPNDTNPSIQKENE